MVFELILMHSTAGMVGCWLLIEEMLNTNWRISNALKFLWKKFALCMIFEFDLALLLLYSWMWFDYTQAKSLKITL